MRERDQYHFRLATNKMSNPCVLFEDTSTSDFEAADPEHGSSESEEESEVDEDVNETQDEKRISWLVHDLQRKGYLLFSSSSVSLPDPTMDFDCLMK